MLRLTRTVIAATLVMVASVAQAQDVAAEKADALFDALELSAMLDVMREEGIEYGDTIAQDMLPGGPTPRWQAHVAGIYDLEAMETRARASFRAALAGDDVDAMLAFFTAEPGRTIVALELDARQALMDDAVEAAAKEIATLAEVDKTPRFEMINQFVQTNDLVETNVAGALNANYAFFLGLIDGGALPGDITPDMALENVRAQEEQIRQNTHDWVYAFSMLAYEPLPDTDLETYIAFSASQPGQALNSALFTAFDEMFDIISRELGLATAQFMISQDL